MRTHNQVFPIWSWLIKIIQSDFIYSLCRLEKFCWSFPMIINKDIYIRSVPIQNNVHFNCFNIWIIGYRAVVKWYHLILINSNKPSFSSSKKEHSISTLTQINNLLRNQQVWDWRPLCLDLQKKIKTKHDLVGLVQSYIIALYQKLLHSLMAFIV